MSDIMQKTCGPDKVPFPFIDLQFLSYPVRYVRYTHGMFESRMLSPWEHKID